jgi:hypothetical protein
MDDHWLISENESNIRSLQQDIYRLEREIAQLKSDNRSLLNWMSAHISSHTEEET